MLGILEVTLVTEGRVLLDTEDLELIYVLTAFYLNYIVHDGLVSTKLIWILSAVYLPTG